MTKQTELIRLYFLHTACSSVASTLLHHSMGLDVTYGCEFNGGKRTLTCTARKCDWC